MKAVPESKVTRYRKKHPHLSRWGNMIHRCNNPKSLHYRVYGGRGIKVCKAWRKFRVFELWCNKTYKPGLALERINVNRGYSPSNCTWATRSEQAFNRRLTPIKPRSLDKVRKLSFSVRDKKYGNHKTRKKKICSSCKVKKPLKFFSRSAYSSDGLFTYCFICSRARNNRDYYQRKEMTDDKIILR